MAKILLAEDDEFISRMINMRLTLRNHQVEHARNGQQALEKAPGGDYDVVLMDMHMPVVDGHEATRRLRESGYTGLIIAVTASVMSADSDKALNSGCDAYISKPIGTDFEDRIEAMLKPS
jgi:CheY-like chemotaxis protein